MEAASQPAGGAGAGDDEVVVAVGGEAAECAGRAPGASHAGADTTPAIVSCACADSAMPMARSRASQAV